MINTNYFQFITINNQVLSDGYFVKDNWIECIYNGTKLGFKTGGSSAVEVFGFHLYGKSDNPTNPIAGDIWVKTHEISDFTNVVLDEAVRVTYTNQYLMLVVDDTNNGSDTITQTKKTASGAKVNFTSVRDTANDTTLPWQASNVNKSGNIFDIKRKYPLVYSRLNDVLDMETAYVYDGSAWQIISQNGSYLVLGSQSNSNNYLYNRTDASLTLHSGISSFPSATVNCIVHSDNGTNLCYGFDTTPYATFVTRTGDVFVIQSFTLHTSEPVNDATFTHDGTKLFITHMHNVDLYNITNGIPVYSSTILSDGSNSFYGIAVHPADHEIAVTKSAYPYICRIKVSTLTQLAQPNTLPTNMCYKCAYSDDGKYLVVITSGATSKFLVYHIVSDTEWSMLPLNGSTYPSTINVTTTEPVFIPNSDRFMLNSADGTIYFYDCNETTINFVLYHVFGIHMTCIALSFSGTKLAIGCYNTTPLHYLEWYAVSNLLTANPIFTKLVNPDVMPASQVFAIDFIN